MPFRRQRGFAECRNERVIPRVSLGDQGPPDGGGRPEGAGFHGTERRRKAGHLIKGARRGPCDLVVLRLGLHECVPRPALRDARLDGRPAELGCEGVRDQHGQPPQPSGLQGAEPPQLSVAQRLEQDGQHRVWGALRSLRIVRPPRRDEAIRVRAGCRRGQSLKEGHGKLQNSPRPPKNSPGSQEERDVNSRYVWTCLAVLTSGIFTGGTVPPSDAPVFTKTTRSSGVMVPSSQKRRRPARVAAPSRHALIPSRTARFNAATFIAS